jgi:hypothetical protein
MLDAHKDIVISRELKALEKVYLNNIDKEKILNGIISASESYTLRGRPHNGTHTSHLVPGQFNGKTNSPLMIGDKHGFGTTSCILKYADFTQVVESKLNLPIYFIRVYREPGKTAEYLNDFYKSGIKATRAKVIKRFELSNKAAGLVPNVLTIHFDSFVKSPVKYLRTILNFLNVENYKGYLQSCANIIDRTVIN